MPNSKAHLVAILLALVTVLLATTTEAATVFRSAAQVKKTLAEQMVEDDGGDANIFGAAIVTVDRLTGFRNGGTIAAGSRQPNTNTDGTNRALTMFVDTSMRGNTLGELLLSTVTMLIVDQSATLKVDNPIPAKYFPKGISFTHPDFSGQALTLKQLMTHTTGIKVLADEFAAKAIPQGETMKSFIENVFIDGSSTVNDKVKESVWTKDVQPGTPASYLYSKANIGLLGYVIDQYLIEEPGLIRSSVKSVKSFVQEQIFDALGMTSSYFLLPSGSPPQVEGGYSVFENRKVMETSEAGTAVSAVPVSSSYLSDYMFITSASDMAKFVNGLFVNSEVSNLFKIGMMLKEQMIAVTDESRPGVSMQGYGMTAFNIETLCNAADSSTASPAGCSLSADRQVFGVLSVGDSSAVSALCTTAPLVAGQTAETACVATTHAFVKSSIQNPSSVSYKAAVSALNNIFIDPAIYEGDTFTEDNMKRSGFFVFSAVLGLFGAVLFVLFFAYFAEYFLHPAPLAGNVASDAYPKLEDVIARASPFRDR